MLEVAGGGARTALAFAGGELSYSDLDAAAGALARRLRASAPAEVLGGGRVAVVAPNAPALVVAMLGAWRVGAACVPLSTRLREYDLCRTLADARPAVLVSVRAHRAYSFRGLAPRLLEEVETLRCCLFVDEAGVVVGEVTRDGRAAESEPLEPGIGALLYTSGSTGDPKGALVRSACLSGQAQELARRLGLECGDATALAVPATHAFGLSCLLAALHSGGACVLVDAGVSLDALIRAAEVHGATVLHGSPPLFTALLSARPAGLHAVRTGFVAGASSPPGLI